MLLTVKRSVWSVLKFYKHSKCQITSNVILFPYKRSNLNHIKMNKSWEALYSSRIKYGWVVNDQVMYFVSLLFQNIKFFILNGIV